MVDLFQVNCEEIALEQGKTIKEIAEELGVSKTAVRKQIANLGLQTSLRKIGNQFAIEDCAADCTSRSSAARWYDTATAQER